MKKLAPIDSSMAFPAALLDKLRAKLEAEVFDAGASFMIELIEEDRALKAPWAKRRVVATEDLPAGGDCWLVDHAWTFDPRDARAQLEVHPPLAARLAAMLGIEDNGSEGRDAQLRVIIFTFLRSPLYHYRYSQVVYTMHVIAYHCMHATPAPSSGGSENPSTFLTPRFELSTTTCLCIRRPYRSWRRTTREFRPRKHVAVDHF